MSDNNDQAIAGIRRVANRLNGDLPLGVLKEELPEFTGAEIKTAAETLVLLGEAEFVWRLVSPTTGCLLHAEEPWPRYVDDGSRCVRSKACRKVRALRIHDLGLGDVR